MYDILTLQAWIQAVYASDPKTAGARLWMDPYEYVATFTSFNGVSGSTQQVIQINANADFFCTRINYAAGLGAAINIGNAPIVQARLQITDTGTGNTFFNSGCALETIAAHEYPERFLSMPRFCSANTSLALQLVACGTAAETFTYIDIVLEGVRVRTMSTANG